MVKILAWLAVAISAIWFGATPGFEPVVALVVSLLTAITVQVKSSDENHETDVSPVVEENHQTIEIVDEITGPEVNPVINLVDRFLEVFKCHGIHQNEIPRCIPDKYGISLSTLANKDKLIEKLTPELINWVCSTFNIRRNWLETGCDRIYKTENFYKNEHSLPRLLKSLKEEHSYNLRVIAYKGVEELNSCGERPQDINLLIVVPALDIDRKPIMKYIPTSTRWDWGYWRSRYQLKSIIRVCYKRLGLTFDGHDLNSDKMSELSSGRVFPKLIIENTRVGYTWYPDDYTDKENESVCAKETHEIDSILKYIKEQRYNEIFSSSA